MTVTTIEPGLLRIFRWFVAIRLSLLVIVLWVVERNPDPTNPRFPGAGIVFFAPLLLLLVWPAAERRLGRAFLPITLTIAGVAPIVESAVTIEGRLAAGMSVNDAFADVWQPFFLLFVPLLLIAWQYRYRAVVLFAVGTTLLDLAATVAQIEGTNAAPEAVTGLLFARGLLFAFVGFVVVKLAAAQKASRRAIAAHAATLEALATSRERNRLARELHDTLAHSLSAVAVQLEAVKALWHDDPDEAQRMLDRSLLGARNGLGEARRAIQALRASPLEELGLIGALDRLRTETEARSSLEVEMNVDAPLGDLDPHLEQAVFRIADEALTNVVRHASARHAEVELQRRGAHIELRVSDDGAGFDPDLAAEDGHHGVTGMRERAEMVGGVLALETAPGTGTTVRFAAEVRA